MIGEQILEGLKEALQHAKACKGVCFCTGECRKTTEQKENAEKIREFLDTYKSNEPCLWDSLPVDERGKAYAMVCTCSKCSMRC